MAIPEAQLETWANQGGTTLAQRTYASIQTALGSSISRIRQMDFDVYLQGSYNNSTNIRGDSDVDIVVELNSVFYRDISALDYPAQQRYLARYSTASYTWRDFRADVLASLRAYYGAAAVPLPEPRKLTNAAPSRDHLDIRNVADDLKLPWRLLAEGAGTQGSRLHALIWE